MIDTLSYLNAKKHAHWSKRLSPPTSLKVDRLVAAGVRPFGQYLKTSVGERLKYARVDNVNTDNKTFTR